MVRQKPRKINLDMFAASAAMDFIGYDEENELNE